MALLRGGVVCWLQAQIPVIHAPKVEPPIAQHHEARVDPQRAELVRLLANIMSHHFTEQAA